MKVVVVVVIILVVVLVVVVVVVPYGKLLYFHDLTGLFARASL